MGNSSPKISPKAMHDLMSDPGIIVVLRTTAALGGNDR